MPYTEKEIKKRPFYQNILDADKNELKKFFEDEEIRAEQSGSTIEAVRTLRDVDGFILSEMADRVQLGIWWIIMRQAIQTNAI